ncbi:unnamed protein product [Gulo gulo]|uniref:Uncharacterized protein n=1 Tax=Gulo gulo TaxID=48420 RepID=A0A9X9LEP0_GULGU|nr:unnamed protein product [Gulo gulo]
MPVSGHPPHRAGATPPGRRALVGASGRSSRACGRTPIGLGAFLEPPR